jgi:hypothetical protein
VSAEPVRIEGLRELVRDFRRAEGNLPKEIQKSNKSLAEKVAERTKASFSSRDGVAPKVAASVKALATQRGAHVRIGGNAYPYALGSEFGAIVFKQFPPWRGNGPGAGYSLFPTIRSMRTDIEKEFLDGVERAFHRAFS